MFNSNLTHAERERIAYASGILSYIEIVRGAAELEDQLLFNEEISEELQQSEFQRGKDEGFGMDAAETLRNMEHDLEKAQEVTKTAKDILRQLLDLFHTDAMKTIAGRKEIYKQLQNKLIRLGY